jgi:hypothetical protein
MIALLARPFRMYVNAFALALMVNHNSQCGAGWLMLFGC